MQLRGKRDVYSAVTGVLNQLGSTPVGAERSDYESARVEDEQDVQNAWIGLKDVLTCAFFDSHLTSVLGNDFGGFVISEWRFTGADHGVVHLGDRTVRQFSVALFGQPKAALEPLTCGFTPMFDRHLITSLIVKVRQKPPELLSGSRRRPSRSLAQAGGRFIECSAQLGRWRTPQSALGLGSVYRQPKPIGIRTRTQAVFDGAHNGGDGYAADRRDVGCLEVATVKPVQLSPRCARMIVARDREVNARWVDVGKGVKRQGRLV